MNNLIFNWEQYRNHLNYHNNILPRRIEFFDETLRDGLQATYIRYPSLSEKIKFLERANKLGVDSLNIGMPMSGKKHFNECIALAKYIKTNKLRIVPACIGRVLVKDVEIIAKVSQTARIQIVAHLLGGEQRNASSCREMGSKRYR